MVDLTSKHLFVIYFLTLFLLSGCSSKLVLETGSSTLSLHTARFGHAVVSDGSKIYALAGSNERGFLSDIEIIDPISKKKQILGNQLLRRRYFSAVWDGDHSIYILGGVSIRARSLSYQDKVEVFDTITHEVSYASPLPIPTRTNGAVFLDGKIYVLGGTRPVKRKSTPTALVLVYNIAEDRWSRAADMPTAKTAKAVVKNGQIYVVGGYDTKSSMDVFEKYNPKTNQWKSLPSLPEKNSAHSLTIVKDKLYVFGNYNHMTSTYRYDFSTQQWEKINIGYKASRHNDATTLGDKAYVIGGNAGRSGPYLDDIQIFEF